jgi:hypothetical protein
MFRMDLRTNSDYFPTQYLLIGFLTTKTQYVYYAVRTTIRVHTSIQRQKHFPWSAWVWNSVSHPKCPYCQPNSLSSCQQIIHHRPVHNKTPLVSNPSAAKPVHIFTFKYTLSILILSSHVLQCLYSVLWPFPTISNHLLRTSRCPCLPL